MVKILFAVILSLALIGCETMPAKVEIQEKVVPVMFTPKPAEVVRPILVSKQLTQTQLADIGELSKALGIDLIQMTDYAKVLEEIIAAYDKLSKQNPSFLNLGIYDVNSVDAVQNYYKEKK